MRKNFTALLLLIPVFALLFSCSKNQSHSTTPVDSTANNVYLDPGTVSAIINTDTFQSLNGIQAYDDTLGMIYITAKALINTDTTFFYITFPDTLAVNISHTTNFKLGFVDSVGTIYLNDTQPSTGDTLLLTTFDKATHTLAGKFSGPLTGSSKADGQLVSRVLHTSGSFNTYFNIPGK